jgi:endonuclease-8
MPEGPEIRRAADKIAAVLENEVIEDLFLGLGRLKKFRRTLMGTRVCSIETRGKALLTHFNTDWTLYSHNQLYGVWHVVDRGQYPTTKRTLRVALHTARHSALLYSASDIWVLTKKQLTTHPFLSRIGPDILDTSLTWRVLLSRLTDPRFKSRKLATLYLDQQFLAGIGNYLRSEIIHDAGLDPALRPIDLNRVQLGRLARSTLTISKRSYTSGGITNKAGIARRLKSQGKSHAAYRFAIFDREGECCYRCGGSVIRSTLNSRRLYSCAQCQTSLFETQSG